MGKHLNFQSRMEVRGGKHGAASERRPVEQEMQTGKAFLQPWRLQRCN